ncbi:MAG: selenium-dependent molybdenum cofactor biosynthesis protein YqeB [Defluviitaleaceae bacterium]|nr:selenium-dependent molybdenum cofactor biosynthesis protein YqeB [Defluviitaleaceae bacterium]
MNKLIIIRGGGDLATGVIQKFFRAGFNVLVLETNFPTAIRRTVSLSEAVYTGTTFVEDMTCQLVSPEISEIKKIWSRNEIPLIIDSEGKIIETLQPDAVIDAIMAKCNLGTNRNMAPITIGLGPGFAAKVDVDIVIETKRGHNLGRLIMEGSAIPNTGIPGLIGGKSTERVLYAPKSGKIKHIRKIGDLVQQGEILFYVSDMPVQAPFDGLLRGLIQENLEVSKGTKVGDVDPRKDVDVYTISDKARCIGGGVLEAYLYLCTLTGR